MTETFEWSTKVSELEMLIEKIANPYKRKSLTDRFIRLISRSRKTPNLRAHSFKAIQDWVARLTD